MSGASFSHPEWLVPLTSLWLLLLAGIGIVRLRSRRRSRSLLGALPGRVAGAKPGRSRDLHLLLALLAIGLALLGPRIGTRSERLATSGIDVVLLVDVSRSMDARDVPPSRLDRARQAAARLLADLEPGDRAALAVFAGGGVVLTPLTPDHVALAEILPALDTALVRPAASRLGEGVRQAVGAFESGSERPRVLVVFSDGEDADGGEDLGVVEVRRAGVRVVAVALGTEAGGTIPSGGLELRDRRGQIVTTRADPARLAALVAATDGRLLGHDALGSVDTATLVASVRRDAPKRSDTDGVVVRSVPAVRIVPFALAALLILGLEGSARSRRAGPVVATAVLGVLALGASPELRDLRGVRDARALLARGLALAESERWEEAEHSFRAAALAAREPDLATNAYHDAGVAALRAGRLEAARDAFFEAAALAPGNLETRFNLEWTLRALTAEPPPPPPPATGSPRAADESAEEHERPESGPEPETRPETARQLPQARPAAPPEERPPALTPEEVARWLERTEEDPAHALRSLRGEETESRRGSAW